MVRGRFRRPVFELPSVLDATGLLDKAFGRAAKATATGPDRIARARNLAAARVRIAGQTIESTLRGIVKGFPSLDRLPPFYRELVDILVDANQLKKHLGAIDWAADRTANMARDYRRRIGKAERDGTSGDLGALPRRGPNPLPPRSHGDLWVSARRPTEAPGRDP